MSSIAFIGRRRGRDDRILSGARSRRGRAVGIDAIIGTVSTSSTKPEDLPTRSLPPARRDAIHRALLAGLLGNVGMKTDDVRVHRRARARSSTSSPAPACSAASRSGSMAGELVETTQLYARTVAAHRPAMGRAASAEHLVKREYTEPHWRARRPTSSRTSGSRCTGCDRPAARRPLRADRPEDRRARCSSTPPWSRASTTPTPSTSATTATSSARSS